MAADTDTSFDKRAVHPFSANAPDRGATQSRPSNLNEPILFRAIEQGTTKRMSTAQQQQQQHTADASASTVSERQGSGPLLESAEDAARHRKDRGEPEPRVSGASGFGRHYDIGGKAEYGPVDTHRMDQVDERDIPARVP